MYDIMNLDRERRCGMANKTIVKINDCCKKIQFLNGAQLKLIAIVSMLIDHINKSMIYPNLVTNDGFLTKLSNFPDCILCKK